MRSLSTCGTDSTNDGRIPNVGVAAVVVVTFSKFVFHEGEVGDVMSLPEMKSTAELTKTWPILWLFICAGISNRPRTAVGAATSLDPRSWLTDRLKKYWAFLFPVPRSSAIEGCIPTVLRAL